MAIRDLKILDADYAGKDVASAPDRLTGTAAQNKNIFDRLIKELLAGRINAVIDLLNGAGGAGEIGTKLGKTLAAALLSDDIDQMRLNIDGVIEVKKKGSTEFIATGSSGHVILAADGTALPQRSRMQFANCTVSDNGTVTIIKGVTGETGAKGDQGVQGEKGVKGDKGEVGFAIIPSVDQNTGLMSFTAGALGAVPAAVYVKGPQGPQGVRGAQGEIGPQGVQGTQGVQGVQGAKGETGAIGATGVQGQKGLQGQKGDAGARGLQGEQGPIGPQGVQGLQGATGLTGLQGVKGEKGDKGEIGASGLMGAKGDKGEQGARGIEGAQGARGIQGEQGLTGATGAQGLQGIKGDKGDKGETGATGLVGAKGEKGDIGATGATGATGLQGIAGPTGAQGIQGIQGQKGDRGKDGNSFEIDDIFPTLSALQAKYPTGTLGAFQVTANSEIYIWSEANIAWQSIGKLQGPQGPQGAQGVQGVQGPQGATGAKGDIGATGPQGATGAKGDTGAQGLQGEKGLKGDIGATGPQGATGPRGETGAQGAVGATGIQGAQGIQGEKGLKGDPGVQGEKGVKGDIGATGAQGATGATGMQGAQGLQGEKGLKGDPGIQGAKGDTGAQGIQGVQGAKGDIGAQGAQGIQGVQGATGPKGDKGDTAKINGKLPDASGNITLGAADVGFDNLASGLAAMNVQDAINELKAKIQTTLTVHVEANSIVTATCGAKKLEETAYGDGSGGGVCVFINPTNGTWQVSATLDGLTSTSASVVIDGVSASCTLKYTSITVNTAPKTAGFALTAWDRWATLQSVTKNSGKAVFTPISTQRPWIVSGNVLGKKAITYVNAIEKENVNKIFTFKEPLVSINYSVDPSFPWKYDPVYSDATHVAYMAGNSEVYEKSISNISISVNEPGIISFEYRISTEDIGYYYNMWFKFGSPITEANYKTALNYNEFKEYRGEKPWQPLSIMVTPEDIVNRSATLYIAYRHDTADGMSDNKVAISHPIFKRA